MPYYIHINTIYKTKSHNWHPALKGIRDTKKHIKPSLQFGRRRYPVSEIAVGRLRVIKTPNTSEEPNQYFYAATREKGSDLAQSCDKNPYTYRTIQKATWQHKNATKNFDYTTIADRLRTVSWSNRSHPTGVVKPVYERSIFQLTATAV